LVGKQTECKPDHTPPSSAQIQNAWYFSSFVSMFKV